jgi:hypothetical protein
VQAAINENRQWKVWELEALGILRTTVSEILTEDFGMKRGGKICSMAAVTKAVEISCWSCTGLLKTTNKDPDFLRKGHGSMAMTLKQKLSLPNGSRLSLHIHRQHGQVRAMSRPCWRFFLIIKVLSSMSTLLHARYN